MLIATRQQARLGSWSEDAKAAMLANPDYFMWWDRWKTRLLIVALGALAVQQVSRRRRRRR